MPVDAISEITGIHWKNGKKIHLEFMNECLKKRKKEILRSGYKPTYLAVDEFAINVIHHHF